MCGIAGIFHYGHPERPIQTETLLAMTRSLAHRGPDGEGTYVCPGLGFGHRRLAILDTSAAGAQPMAASSGDAVITYNGEVYNFRELRRELEALGYAFRSGSDTEVLLEGYRAWGEQLLSRIEGIFAFAIWDARRRRLLLARDPIGVKPLFYADSGKTIRFGSEIKAILTDPEVSRAIDLGAIGRYLAQSFTPAPYTGFKAVRQLEPGQLAIVDAAGVRFQKYYEIPYSSKARERSFEVELNEFDSLLDRVTKDQMVSDVPVGGFLSGGLDSAAIVRSMKRAALGDVHALTIGFDVSGFDESGSARKTARALGVEHEVERMQISADLVPRVSLHVEEPFADSSILPVWLLCAAARRRFTVAMSGDGADDILAGYDTYQATMMASYLRWIPRAIRDGVLLRAAESLPVTDAKYGLRRVSTRLLRGVARGPGRDHASWRMIFDETLQRRLFSQQMVREYVDPLGEYAAFIGQVPPSREPITGLLHADTAYYLPNDMLVKVDRMSMAHGLEVRVPFLDTRMVAYAANLHGRYKLHGLRGRKYILRESLRASLPAEVIGLPKSGFNAPIERWFRGPLRSLLLDTVASVRDDLGLILDVKQLEAVAEEHRTRRHDHAHALFAALMLALWLHNRRTAWKSATVEAPTAVSSL